MDRRFSPVLLFALLILLCLLSACGSSRVGTVPRGTPDTGNGTPAVLPTATLAVVPSAAAGTTGKTYAFIRKDQLWVALNGAAAVQVTHFNYEQAPNVFWQRPLWSPGDRYLAMILNASPAGLGGGGCPGPDFGASGSLYVMDAATKQFTAVTFPTVQKNVSVSGVPQNSRWEYVFWEDSTHLLAWYNGVAGNVGNTVGLYRYDVAAGKLSLVLPLRTLGVTTLTDPQKGMPLMLSMRYSKGQLFYQVVVHPFEQKSQLVIYRHSITQSTAQSSKVFDMGSEAWCNDSAGGAYMRPGWDVSPDGVLLVAQHILTGDANVGKSAVQVHRLDDGSETPLFAQMSPDLLAHDLALSWGPDSQTVVATENHPLLQKGPCVASLADPTAMQQYSLALSGPVIWRSDSSAFALQQMDMTDTTGISTVYVFLVGDTHGYTLLTNAHEFDWG
jgi:hypothetical protein